MELFDICDEQGNPTGDTVERSEAHAKGICHRTAHIWIAKQENGRYKVLLQKRSMDKDSFLEGMTLPLPDIYRRAMNRWSRHSENWVRSWA